MERKSPHALELLVNNKEIVKNVLKSLKKSILFHQRGGARGPYVA